MLVFVRDAECVVCIFCYFLLFLMLVACYNETCVAVYVDFKFINAFFFPFEVMFPFLLFF